MKHSPIRRIWHDCTAAEVAEAAFVLPLMFVFLIGIFQFARVYMVYSAMQRAAEEGVHAAAGSDCATCGNTQLAADVVASGYVHPVLAISHVDDTQLTAPAPANPLTSCTNGAAIACDPIGVGASPKICLRRDVILNKSSGGLPPGGAAVCGTALTLVYPYGFTLPSVSTTPPYISSQTYAFNLQAQAQVRGE